MNYDDFDYLNQTLTNWYDKYAPDYNSHGLEYDPLLERELNLIEREYLPRFEAAIHRLHSTNSSAWSHPYIESLPFEVVTADEEHETFAEFDAKERAEAYVERN